MKARCLLVAVLLPWILWKASYWPQSEEPTRWREIGSFVTEQECQKSATREYLYLKRGFQKRKEKRLMPDYVWFNDDTLEIYFVSLEGTYTFTFYCDAEEILPPVISR